MEEERLSMFENRVRRRGRKPQESGENCTMMSFRMFTAGSMLFG
jgi:hypothetical protein